MSAIAADIAPSPTTHVEIGTTRSVRQDLANVGWKSVAGNFFRRSTCMWSSRFLVTWPRWCCKTRRSSTTSCFAPAETLLEVARDPQHLGAEIGFFSVLHSWSQKLELHPHVHCVVPTGGLSADRSRWIKPRYAFFLPVKVLSRVFRGKFVAALQRAFQDGKVSFHGDLQPL